MLIVNSMNFRPRLPRALCAENFAGKSIWVPLSHQLWLALASVLSSPVNIGFPFSVILNNSTLFVYHEVQRCFFPGGFFSRFLIGVCHEGSWTLRIKVMTKIKKSLFKVKAENKNSVNGSPFCFCIGSLKKIKHETICFSFSWTFTLAYNLGTLSWSIIWRYISIPGKRELFENDGVTIIVWFGWPSFTHTDTNPKWLVMAAFLKFCGVVWTEIVWCVYCVESLFFPSLWCGTWCGRGLSSSASLTERICSAFSKEVVPPTLWTQKRRLTRSTFLPLTLIAQKNGQSAGRNSKISRTGPVRVSSHVRELDASTKTEDLTG